MFGLKLISSMTLRTRVRVFLSTLSGSFKHLETVDIETPASLATSAIVGFANSSVPLIFFVLAVDVEQLIGAATTPSFYLEPLALEHRLQDHFYSRRVSS
jgi:hypothetical protein